MKPDKEYEVEIITKAKDDNIKKVSSGYCTMKGLITLINRNYNKITYITARVRNDRS